MTHADAFLRDILAHPDDDAPRLIFADWLEEQGDANSIARAEFIRIQCALAAEHVSERRRAQLGRRADEILDEWDQEWIEPVRRLVRGWVFHRGFIDDVSMWAHTFVAHAGRLFRRAPIQHLILEQNDDHPIGRYMAALADIEQLSRLHSLNLSGLGLESRDLRALVVSKHLSALTSLDLSNNRIGVGGIRALASSSLLGKLERLNLRYTDIGATGLRILVRALEALANSPDGLHLQRLELHFPSIRAYAAGKRVIAESPLLRRLLRL